MSPLLVKARREGRTIVEVTPASAGWVHVGFRAVRLAEGFPRCASSAWPPRTRTCTSSTT